VSKAHQRDLAVIVANLAASINASSSISLEPVVVIVGRRKVKNNQPRPGFENAVVDDARVQVSRRVTTKHAKQPRGPGIL